MKTIQLSKDAFDLLEGAVEQFLDDVVYDEEWLGEYRTEGEELVRALGMVHENYWLERIVDPNQQ